MEGGTQQHGTSISSSSPGMGNAGEVKRKASELTQTARERAMSALDGQKEQLSSLLGRMADTAEGDRLGSYAADYARRGSAYLRGHSAEEIVSSVRSGIRSRPGLLLSVCFVAGLAAARLLRRDADGSAWRAGWRDEEEPWDREAIRRAAERSERQGDGP